MISSELAFGLATAAFALALVNVFAVAVLVGKVFFSTHKREFVPLEQFERIKQTAAKAIGRPVDPEREKIKKAEQESVLWEDKDLDADKGFKNSLNLVKDLKARREKK